jgi:asparaginyl-tRNA synthetase
MPHIRTRTPFNALMLRFRSQCIAQLTSFFAAKDFVQTHPPIITSSDCEGAGEVFNVATEGLKRKPLAQVGRHDVEAGNGAFFRSTKYLTVSSQLHLEALAQSVGKVWALSPTFRAEKSDTSRHLSEFYMLEAEVYFVNHLEGIMTLVEDMIRNLTQTLHDSKVGQEIIYGRRTGESGLETQQTNLSEELERRWQGMMSSPWPRITYADALSLLLGSNERFEHPASWGMGLQAEHERFIASAVGRGKPVFVTNYPQKLKPFYMLPSAYSSTSGPTVDCFDLLVPEVCEISGGSMREYRLPQLLETMQSHGLVAQSTTGTPDGYPSDEDLGALKWYVDLRRWGSVPHGGFGLGFDRLLGYLAGVENIREVVAFPRWVGRCDC